MSRILRDTTGAQDSFLNRVFHDLQWGADTAPSFFYLVYAILDCITILFGRILHHSKRYAPTSDNQTKYGLHLPNYSWPAEPVCTIGANDSLPERPPEIRTWIPETWPRRCVPLFILDPDNTVDQYTPGNARRHKCPRIQGSRIESSERD